jgi:hypothetical protein
VVPYGGMGQVAGLSIAYRLDGSDDPVGIMINLSDLEAAMRPERYRELLDDLTVACQDVLRQQDDCDRQRVLRLVEMLRAHDGGVGPLGGG